MKAVFSALSAMHDVYIKKILVRKYFEHAKCLLTFMSKLTSYYAIKLSLSYISPYVVTFIGFQIMNAESGCGLGDKTSTLHEMRIFHFCLLESKPRTLVSPLLQDLRKFIQFCYLIFMLLLFIHIKIPFQITSYSLCYVLIPLFFLFHSIPLTADLFALQNHSS